MVQDHDEGMLKHDEMVRRHEEALYEEEMRRVQVAATEIEELVRQLARKMREKVALTRRQMAAGGREEKAPKVAPRAELEELVRGLVEIVATGDEAAQCGEDTTLGGRQQLLELKERQADNHARFEADIQKHETIAREVKADRKLRELEREVRQARARAQLACEEAKRTSTVQEEKLQVLFVRQRERIVEQQAHEEAVREHEKVVQQHEDAVQKHEERVREHEQAVQNHEEAVKRQRDDTSESIQ